MPRAVAIFEAAGIQATASPTDFEVVDREASTIVDWLPDAGALHATTRALREYLGLLAHRLRV